MSSNISFIPAPVDGGKLQSADGGIGKRAYVGEQRRYEVLGAAGRRRTQLQVTLANSGPPYSDTINLDAAKDRTDFARRLAGPARPDLVPVFELDLRQIAADPEAGMEDDAGPASEGGDQQLIGHFPDLIDLVLVEDRVGFLAWHQSGVPRIKFSAEVEGANYVPPTLADLPFAIPTREAVQAHMSTTSEQLWDEIAQWIERSAVPPDGYLDLLVAWCFHTHCTERSTHSPIIALVGPPAYGKTRLAKSLLYCARRGVVTETPNAAHLLRYAENLDATLFLDLWDAWRSITGGRVQDIMLQRFDQGARIPRVTDLEAGPFRDTTFYRVYGPTVLASNTALPPVLATRCISIQMKHQDTERRELVYPVEKAALSLRAALVAWRARTFHEPLPDVQHNLKGRLADIGKSLLQITKLVAPGRFESVLDALNDAFRARQAAYSETWEGRVLSALIDLQSEVQSGLLSVARVTQHSNKHDADRNALTNQQVGNVLRELGFKTRTFGKARLKHVEYDDAVLQSLADTFLPQEGLDG